MAKDHEIDELKLVADRNLEKSVEAVQGADMWSIDAERFGSLSSRAGRVHSPRLLLLAWEYDKLAEGTLARVLGEVWGAPEFPEQSLDVEDWRALFADAGYVVNGSPADRPAGPVTLYRGATYERRRGWSWTPDVDLAARFVERARIFDDSAIPTATVWIVKAPPESLCFASLPNGRGEDEYIIDPRRLRITKSD